jgi:hypothetical protein
MRCRLLLVFLLAPLTAPSLCAPAPQAPAPRLELRLRAATAKVKHGQPVRWKVALVNRDRHGVTLVRPGDGSDCGWRTPIIEWLVNGQVDGAIDLGQVDRKPKTNATPTPAPKPDLKPACLTGNRRRVARCGNINRLKASDVFDLAPGKQITFEDWLGPPDLPVGTHRVAVRYFNIPDLKWKGLPLGQHDEKAMTRIRSSPRVTLQSNTVEIVVQK